MLFKESLNNPFMSLKHKNFFVYWVSMCISFICSWMQNIAQPWLAYSITKSAFLLGVVGAMQYAPLLIFSLFAGVYIDKFNKKKIIIFTQLALLLITMILAILVWTETVQYWHILLLATAIGCVNTLDIPTRQSFVVELVGKKDLMNAIALNSMVFNIARIVGPALAGLIMAYVGIAFCFFINSVSFGVVVIAMFFIKPLKTEIKTKENLKVMAEIKDGLGYIYNNKILLKSILSLAIVSTFAMNFNVLVPVFTRGVLGRGEASFGLLMSFTGIGSLIGAFLVATSSKKGPQKFVLNIVPFVIAILVIITGLTNMFIVTGLLMAATGLFLVSFNSTTNSTVQLNTEDEYRGRVMSVYSLVFGGLTPLGSLYSGSITEAFGPRIGFVACGIIMIVLFSIESFSFRSTKIS
jgi:MFS family permease